MTLMLVEGLHNPVLGVRTLSKHQQRSSVIAVF